MPYPTPTINEKNSTAEILLHMIIVLLSNSTNLVAPSYTTVQRDAIVSPTSGMLITNTTTGTLELYYGGVWNPFVING